MNFMEWTSLQDSQNRQKDFNREAAEWEERQRTQHRTNRPETDVEQYGQHLTKGYGK